MRGKPERHLAMSGKMPRRATDIVEDAVVWILSSMALLLLVVAVTVGVATYGHLAERARLESASHTEVTAVVVEASPVHAVAGEDRLPVRVEARWSAPDGAPRTGFVPAPSAMPGGATVPVWVDQRGDLVPAPLTTFEVLVAALLTGVCIVAVGGGLLAAAWALARRAIGAANSRRWEREWSEVEPRWRARR